MENIAYRGTACITRKYMLTRLNFDDDFKYLILNSGNAQGYYSRGNFLHDQKKSKDFHLFLVVKKNVFCFQDIIYRENLKISRDFKCNLHMNPAHIKYENKPAAAIRIRPIDIEHIDAIIESLSEQGIEFVKNKKVDPFETVTFYKKYIEFKELQEGVYQDNSVNARYFIKIPGLVSYDEFVKIMNSIKHTTKFKMFDHFLTQLYYNNKIIDFAGIYSKNCQLDKFEEFKQELIKGYKAV